MQTLAELLQPPLIRRLVTRDEAQKLLGIDSAEWAHLYGPYLETTQLGKFKVYQLDGVEALAATYNRAEPEQQLRCRKKAPKAAVPREPNGASPKPRRDHYRLQQLLREADPESLQALLSASGN